MENAYYKPGFSRQGLAGFLGTEVANYSVTAHGLRLLSFQPMKDRPTGDLPVQELISRPQMRHSYYRFYYEVFFKDRTQSHGSVLLGADSMEDLDHLSAELAGGGSSCSATSSKCTLFPEACSVSIEMQILVNGKRRSVVWGTNLNSVIEEHPQTIAMERLRAGRLTPVRINSHDPRELQLPLLPGDHISWH